MQFGKAQEREFGTVRGSYSVVTGRENHDSQITLTDYEAELVLDHFGKANIHIGDVKSNEKQSSKPFRLYPEGRRIFLNIVFPKPNKPELRLYISARAGFKPNGEEIWFMFVKESELWIGAFPEELWRSKSSELKRDDHDDVYQESLDESDAIRVSKLKERDIYVRDRNIAVKRMELSSFTCEFDSTHELFISRYSKKPYLEAHHLIPIGLQNNFSMPLDTVHNVFCLCPYCHRAVHHAEKNVAREMLKDLSGKRSVLHDFSLSILDLFKLYAVEEID